MAVLGADQAMHPAGAPSKERLLIQIRPRLRF